MDFKNIKIPSLLKNRFILVLVLFLFWMIFFDQNSILNSYSNYKEINKMEEKRDFLDSEIAKANLELSILNSNDHALEKEAREKHFMKKDNEDIFVFVKDSMKK